MDIENEKRLIEFFTNSVQLLGHTQLYTFVWKIKWMHFNIIMDVLKIIILLMISIIKQNNLLFLGSFQQCWLALILLTGVSWWTIKIKGERATAECSNGVSLDGLGRLPSTLKNDNIHNNSSHQNKHQGCIRLYNWRSHWSDETCRGRPMTPPLLIILLVLRNVECILNNYQ